MDARRNVTGGTAPWDKGQWLRTVASALFAIAVALGLTGGALAQEGGPPYGSHDGNAGVVTTTGQCGAFGWAVDPDNRDRDLQVQILADGSPVTTVTADIPWEGLAECPGGTCGFGASLWGLISPGIEHQITAQAYDEETASWVNIPGTPKALTCVGFPEGFHDGAQGVVDQYSCNANGWAVDPEDRDRDVSVRILSDGTEIASVPADIYRQDLETLGICPGGTCSWYLDLWGLISHDVEHQIGAQVYDQETGAWLDLASSPKALACTAPPPPVPSIWISTSNDYLRGNDFTPGVTLTFTVYASEGEAEPFLELNRTTDGSGYAFIDGWEHGRDLVVGNYVVVSDGTSTRTLVLEPLTIDVFDPATDYVAGTTSPGELVHVVIGNNDVGYPAEMDVYADEAGEWQANFAGIFDIPWDMWGSADVFDEDGDRTVFHLGASPPPTARLVVFPEAESVHTWDLPAGTEVHLTIDDPAIAGDVSYEDTATVGPAPWDENQILAYFDFDGYFDVKVGDIVTVSYLGTSVQHVVEFVSVTGTDADLDTVFGEAAPIESVYVWQHGEDWAMQVPVAAGDGAWTADFTGTGLDLVAGACGRAEVRDEEGDSTAQDWCVRVPPNPFIWADPLHDGVVGWDWPDGEALTFELFDADSNLVYSAETVIEGGTGFELRPEGIDLQAGHRVVYSTDSLTKELVVTSLWITGFDVPEGAIRGTFDPAFGFWINAGGQEPLQSLFDEDRWVATFSGLEPRMCGEVAQPDDDGDMTGIGFCVPNPHFTVFLEWEAFELWEWPIGASVHLSIEDPASADSPDFEDDYIVPPAEWNPEESFLWIDLAGAYDVKPGDEVTITGAGFVVPHTVRSLTVDAVDPETNTVAGTADPGEVVVVWPHDLGHWTAGLPVVTGEDGSWIADLDDLPYDLVPWTSGRAEIVDAIGNTTGIDWQAPLPVEIDIQPWNHLNLITCAYPAAWLPVAVFSTEGFDATQLYTDSIRFGRSGAEAEVIRLGRDERPVQYATDVNRDGLPDMIYFFRFGDTGFSCADIPTGQRSARVEPILTGWMDGGIVEGSDSLTLFRLFGH